MTTLSAGRWSERSDNLDDPNLSTIITPGGHCDTVPGQRHWWVLIWPSAVIRILIVHTVFRYIRISMTLYKSIITFHYRDKNIYGLKYRVYAYPAMPQQIQNNTKLGHIRTQVNWMLTIMLNVHIIVYKYQPQNLPVSIKIMPVIRESVYLSDQARLLESYDITPFPKSPAS